MAAEARNLKNRLMKILFIHQNFPGQFKFLAPALASQKHEVVAMTLQMAGPTPTPAQELPAQVWMGVRLVPYSLKRGTSPTTHPWVSDFETKAIRGEACFRAALQLKAQGFRPDIIIAHPGWGESLFLKDVWPTARLGIYCEFFYNASGADVGFDPEFKSSEVGDVGRLRLKNASHLLHFETADAGLSPTHWQASTFPARWQKNITVVHDGIDTQALAPAPNVNMTLQTAAGAVTLTRSDDVVTFVSRNLEPYRGYHIFMRSLSALFKAKPAARVMIVGSDGVSYGTKAPDGRTWKDIFAQEVRSQLSDAQWAQVHFLGRLAYPLFVNLLQLSRAHVYLTYPFVLSWSLLEAMSIGCAIVASDTQPLHEAIVHGETGRLVNFFDPDALAGEVAFLLNNPTEAHRLGANARAVAQSRYDLNTVCLPAQMKWVEALSARC